MAGLVPWEDSRRRSFGKGEAPVESPSGPTPSPLAWTLILALGGLRPISPRLPLDEPGPLPPRGCRPELLTPCYGSRLRRWADAGTDAVHVPRKADAGRTPFMSPLWG